MVLIFIFSLMFISAINIIFYSYYLTAENEKKMKGSKLQNKKSKALQNTKAENVEKNISVQDFEKICVN